MFSQQNVILELNLGLVSVKGGIWTLGQYYNNYKLQSHPCNGNRKIKHLSIIPKSLTPQWQLAAVTDFCQQCRPQRTILQRRRSQSHNTERHRVSTVAMERHKTKRKFLGMSEKTQTQRVQLTWPCYNAECFSSQSNFRP